MNKLVQGSRRSDKVNWEMKTIIFEHCKTNEKIKI